MNSVSPTYELPGVTTEVAEQFYNLSPEEFAQNVLSCLGKTRAMGMNTLQARFALSSLITPPIMEQISEKVGADRELIVAFLARSADSLGLRLVSSEEE